MIARSAGVPRRRRAGRPRRRAAPRRHQASRRSRRRHSRRSRTSRRSGASSSGCVTPSPGEQASGGRTRRPCRRRGSPVTRSARRATSPASSAVSQTCTPVDHHADVVEPGLVEQRDRLADRGEERRLARFREVRGLEPEPHAGGARRRGHLHEALAHDRARLIGRAIADRPGQADDRGRLEAREPRHARAQRVDALLRIGRALHAGQRELQEGRDGGHAVGDAEAALAHEPRARLVVALGQLELPDADAVEARRRCRPRRRRRTRLRSSRSR